MTDRATLKSIGPLYKFYQFLQFLDFQAKLRRAALRDWRDSRDASAEAVPPARLRHRVHGALEKESFLRLGRILSGDIQDILAAIGRDLGSFPRVLDFGCGCGRVLRYLRHCAPACEFHGTDIDAEPIAWCQRNLPGIHWSTNGWEPPLPYPDDSFDLVYAVSVFTHLDERLQNAWLLELRRVVKPGAHLILTVHGRDHTSTLAPAEIGELESRGFLYLTGATGFLKLDGLPDFYQTACHTQDYVRRVWSRHFEIVRYLEQGIAGYQDAVLVRKPGSSAP